jgi:geranylgeranyl diphosphate synthase type II
VKEQNFKAKLATLAQTVDKALQDWLPLNDEGRSANLNEACRYSVLAGGKRIRAVLPLLLAEIYQKPVKPVLRMGCAIELIHAYSLIHDDLPAMDNDDFRRGRPTNHKVFGEAMAILAGDNLLTLAFAWLAGLNEFDVSEAKVIEIIKKVASAAGGEGMIGGQVLDLAAENSNIDVAALENIHRLKTGALIQVPVACAALICDAPEKDFDKLSEFAFKLGLLFQIVDDILDVEGSLEELGKMPGRDASLGKSTYPGLLGLDSAVKMASEIHSAAISALNGLSVDYSLLAEMADFIYSRKN